MQFGISFFFLLVSNANQTFNIIVVLYSYLDRILLIIEAVQLYDSNYITKNNTNYKTIITRDLNSYHLIEFILSELIYT